MAGPPYKQGSNQEANGVPKICHKSRHLPDPLSGLCKLWEAISNIVTLLQKYYFGTLLKQGLGAVFVNMKDGYMMCNAVVYQSRVLYWKVQWHSSLSDEMPPTQTSLSELCSSQVQFISLNVHCSRLCIYILFLEIQFHPHQ